MENQDLLSKLLSSPNLDNLQFVLKLENENIVLKNVKLMKSFAPVKKPSIRGGVYFSEKEIFKISAILYDASLLPKFSMYMLGPNSEFKKMQIIVKNFLEDEHQIFSIFTNLTNSIQSSNSIELNMKIIETSIDNL